jgi:hypothetical protein
VTRQKKSPSPLQEVFMAKYRHLAVFVAVLLTLALVGSIAWADTVIDPQIFIQPSGTAPAGGDPNLITDTTSFVIGVAGNFTLQDPLLVIVGVYDGGSATLSSTTGCLDPSACPLATVGTYGLSTNDTSFTSGTAYAALGLTAGGSESFANWSAADTSAGLAAPTSFELEVFQITGNLTSGSTFTLDTTAPFGSFIIGYSCEDGTGSSTGCATKGDIGQTPFTNAGFINTSPPTHKIPEPAGLATLGSGLLLTGGMLRRRLRKNV